MTNKTHIFLVLIGFLVYLCLIGCDNQDDIDNVFDKDEIEEVYVNGIFIMSPTELYLEENGEGTIIFRINPSDANLNLDLNDVDCHIALDYIGDFTRTQPDVTQPELFNLIEISNSIRPDGDTIPGQYEARIKDNGIAIGYCHRVCFVVKSEGMSQISSEAISVTNLKTYVRLVKLVLV